MNVYINLLHPRGKMFNTIVLDLGVTRDFVISPVLQCNIANCPQQNKVTNQRPNFPHRQIKNYCACI